MCFTWTNVLGIVVGIAIFWWVIRPLLEALELWWDSRGRN